MKKLLTILFTLSIFVTSAQITDDSLKSYVNTYIITNASQSITAAQLNTLFNDWIDSKVNIDSATNVRLSSALDTLFVQYWGQSEDTVVLADQYWSRSGSNLTTATAGDTLGSSTANIPKIYVDTLINQVDEQVEIPYGVQIKNGWGTWAPTLTWQTNTPTVDSAKYRYMEVNNTVYVQINIWASNASGGNVTGLQIPLPVTPSDINMYINIPADAGQVGSAPTKGFFYIDQDDNTAGNRKIKSYSLSFPNTESWYFGFSGFYEVTR